jgi:hypothetical protein
MKSLPAFNLNATWCSMLVGISLALPQLTFAVPPTIAAANAFNESSPVELASHTQPLKPKDLLTFQATINQYQELLASIESPTANYGNQVPSITNGEYEFDAQQKFKRAKQASPLPLGNDISEFGTEAEIAALKSEYISPFNYTQDPIAFNMGSSSVAGPYGTYHGGISSIWTANVPNVQGSQNTAKNVDAVELWGQTRRFGGFALGGTLTAAVANQQIGQPNSYSSTGIVTPTQAYIDYEYKDIFEVTGGNILLTGPWVNSISNFPGATYANLNNSYQGVTANLQVNKSLLLTGFRAFTYNQFPTNGFYSTNLYNTMGNPFSNMQGTTTPGSDGVGAMWNPTNNYNLNLWFYQFLDYADMWYVDNEYHLPLSTNTSMDFGVQALTQSSNGSGIPNTTVAPAYAYLPNAATAAANPGNPTLGQAAGNAVGIKWAINMPSNTLTLAYNNVFGATGSYLNGGIVTPYTFGLETDPLYTTPALSSIAELGSGSAYLIKDAMAFLNNSLKASLAFSQFFVNRIYYYQPDKVSEYDAALQYTVPGTNLNFWTRLVYLDQPDYAGGSFWQPRLIVNYTF